MRDDELPADETIENAAAPEGDATHPAGEIRLSPAKSIGVRVSVLAGLAVGAIIAAAADFPPNTTTTSKW